MTKMVFWLLLCFLMGTEAMFAAPSKKLESKNFSVGFVEDHPWIIKKESCANSAGYMTVGGGCLTGFLMDLFEKFRQELQFNYTTIEFKSKDDLLKNKTIQIGLSPITPGSAPPTGAVFNTTEAFIDGSNTTKKYQVDQTQLIKLSLSIFPANNGSSYLASYNHLIKKLINQRHIEQLLERWMVDGKNSWKKEKQLTKF